MKHPLIKDIFVHLQQGYPKFLIGVLLAGCLSVLTYSGFSGLKRGLPSPQVSLLTERSPHEAAMVSLHTLWEQFTALSPTPTSLIRDTLPKQLARVPDTYFLLKATPNRLPAQGWVSSGFGLRRDPFTGLRRRHLGIDIATHKGSIIQAPADGWITYAGLKSGYGKLLIIKHGYGMTTRYAHNSQNLVKAGDVVKRGDKIAFVGNTGRSTNSHLHYEIHIYGIPVNPLNYVPNRFAIIPTPKIETPIVLSSTLSWKVLPIPQKL